MTYFAYAFPRPSARRWFAAGGRGSGPRYLRLNVRDDGDVFVVTAPVPGLRAEDLKIQVLEDLLEIEGQVPTDESEHLLQEIPSGAFRREIRLPAPVQADMVEAGISDGMLMLRLPKSEESRPRSIKVRANQQ